MKLECRESKQDLKKVFMRMENCEKKHSLLREELLNGCAFEESFIRFVTIEKKRMVRGVKRLKNQREIMYQFSKTEKQIENSNLNMERQIETFQL